MAVKAQIIRTSGDMLAISPLDKQVTRLFALEAFRGRSVADTWKETPCKVWKEERAKQGDYLLIAPHAICCLETVVNSPVGRAMGNSGEWLPMVLLDEKSKKKIAVLNILRFAECAHRDKSQLKYADDGWVTGYDSLALDAKKIPLERGLILVRQPFAMCYCWDPTLGEKSLQELNEICGFIGLSFETIPVY